MLNYVHITIIMILIRTNYLFEDVTEKFRCNPRYAFASFEGTQGRMWLFNETGRDNRIFYVAEPVDEYHVYTNIETYEDVNLSMYSFADSRKSDIISALFCPIPKYRGYYGFQPVVDGFVKKTWARFFGVNSEAKQVGGKQPVLHWFHIIHKTNGTPEALFLSPYIEGYLYCIQLIITKEALIKCFKEGGELVFNSTTTELSGAMDVFRSTGDSVIGIRTWYKNGTRREWFRYFRISILPSWSMVDIGPWYKHTIAIDGCNIQTFCYGDSIEIANVNSSHFFISAGQFAWIFPKKESKWLSLPAPIEVTKNPEDEFRKIFDLKNFASYSDYIFASQDNKLRGLAPTGRPRITAIEMDPGLGHGDADAAFTLSVVNISTRSWFFRDSQYLVVFYPEVDKASINVRQDYDYGLYYDSTNDRSDWPRSIADFNTFKYLDAAVSLDPDKSGATIRLFYGQYYMEISNWTKTGHPIPNDYDVKFISESLFNCYQTIDWSLTPYSTYADMLKLIKQNVPGRYTIPSDDTLTVTLISLGITVASISIISFLFCCISCCCCREPVSETAPTPTAFKPDDGSSSKSKGEGDEDKGGKVMSAISESQGAGKGLPPQTGRPKVRIVKRCLPCLELAVFEGTQGKMILLKNYNLYVIYEPVDEYHVFLYQPEYGGKLLKEYKYTKTSAISALFCSIPKYRSFYGFEIVNRIGNIARKTWSAFVGTPTEIEVNPVLDRLPVLEWTHVEDRSKGRPEALFTSPYTSGNLYCVQLIEEKSPKAVINCYKEGGELAFSNTTEEQSGAMDVFRSTGDSVIGLRTWYKNGEGKEWFRYFRISLVPSWSMVDIGPWFLPTSGIDGCYIDTFCTGDALEVFGSNSTHAILGASGSIWELSLEDAWNSLSSPKKAENYHHDSAQYKFLLYGCVASVKDDFFFYQNNKLKKINTTENSQMTPVELDPNLGQGYADAGFSFMMHDGSWRSWFFKDSLYLVVIHPKNYQDTTIVRQDHDYGLYYDSTSDRSDWPRSIADFNTFKYLDAAVNLGAHNSPGRVLFFYGQYYMEISDWTQSGYPVKKDYEIKLIAKDFFNCEKHLDWSLTPYASFERMLNHLESIKPKKYTIPPDQVLFTVMNNLWITLSAVSGLAFLASLLTFLSAEEPKIEPPPVPIQFKLDEKSTTSIQAVEDDNPEVAKSDIPKVLKMVSLKNVRPKNKIVIRVQPKGN